MKGRKWIKGGGKRTGKGRKRKREKSVSTATVTKVGKRTYTTSEGGPYHATKLVFAPQVGELNLELLTMEETELWLFYDWQMKTKALGDANGFGDLGGGPLGGSGTRKRSVEGKNREKTATDPQ